MNSVIIKVIVDDPAVFPPEILKNIPDVTPTVGQRFEITNINTYFTTTCSYYKAKQSKRISSGNPSYTNMNTTMMPYWLTFYERNQSIVMYPVDIAEY